MDHVREKFLLHIWPPTSLHLWLIVMNAKFPPLSSCCC